MKKIFLILLLLCTKLGFSQTFYETSWYYDQVTYTGLLIYYDDNDAFMRVRYESDGQYIVAEFSCFGSQFSEDGLEGYLLKGEDANIVYGSPNYEYSPDNFIFLEDESGQYGTPLIIDNFGLSQSNIDNYLFEVDYWEEIPTSSFTEDYVYAFFEKSEPAYDVLLSYNNNDDYYYDDDYDYNSYNTDTEPYEITSMAYGNEGWAVNMSKGSPYITQTWMTSYEFPDEWITENWDDNYSITSLAADDDTWAVTMSKGSGYGLQTWITDYDFPQDWILKKKQLGYKITSISNSGGMWGVVMTESIDYGTQLWKRSAEYPADWINNLWDKGYSITSVASDNNEWIVVMTKNSGYGYQTWATEYYYPEDWISEKWAEGYAITSVGYNNGLWSVIMSETDYTYQTYTVEEDFPETWINDNWSGGDETYVYNEPIEEEDYEQYTYNNDYTHTTYEETPTIHFVMVANTRDASIGRSCEVDRINATTKFEVAAEALNIPIKKTYIEGHNYNKDEVQRVITNLNPSKNDVVVFIYSGHGFRYSDQTSTYPRIDLRASEYEKIGESTSYNIADIYDIIVAKGARLNIVISDCCNSDIGITSREGFASLASRNHSVSEINKLKQLFIEAEGDMLITSSKPYQTSCGNALDGGFFLNSFFSAMSKETSALSTDNAEWEDIVEVAIENARYKSINSQGCSTQDGVFKSSIK